MALNDRECPICHAPNASSASQCAACQTPFPGTAANFFGDPQADDAATLAGDANSGDMTDLAAQRGWSQPIPPPRVAGFRTGRLANGTYLGRRYEIVSM